MRHRVAGHKLSMDIQQRRALFRNLAVALFTHGQITTTKAKAKAVQPFVERMITHAKKGTLGARRRVIAEMQDRIIVDFDVNRLEDAELSAKQAAGYEISRYGEIKAGPKIVKKLFDEIAPRYKERQGGYTRIIKLAKHRIGDGSDLVVLQLVGEEEVGPQVSGTTSRRRKKADKRMEFAARLRKARSDAPAEAAKSE